MWLGIHIVRSCSFCSSVLQLAKLYASFVFLKAALQHVLNKVRKCCWSAVVTPLNEWVKDYGRKLTINFKSQLGILHSPLDRHSHWMVWALQAAWPCSHRRMPQWAQAMLSKLELRAMPIYAIVLAQITLRVSCAFRKTKERAQIYNARWRVDMASCLGALKACDKFL